MKQTNKYTKELEFAKKLAQNAGEIMRRHFSYEVNTEWKNDSTPLTIADTEINEMVISEVSSSFPEDSVLGEEKSSLKDSNRVWVLDPIDGTMCYGNGVPTSCFALSLIFDCQPVVAVVFDLATGRVYSACKGVGAYLDGKKIKVNCQSDLGPKCFIDVDGRDELRGYKNDKIISVLLDKNVRVTKSYSAVFNSMPVAYGKQAACIGIIEYPWDGAAQALLVEEAGGRVTDLSGNRREWDKEGLGFVVSNGLLHDEIIELIQDTR